MLQQQQKMLEKLNKRVLESETVRTNSNVPPQFDHLHAFKINSLPAKHTKKWSNLEL